MQTILDLSLSQDSVTDPDALANAWLSFCNDQLTASGLADDFACGSIWLDIQSSEQGWFFKRPYALALALELCPAVRLEGGMGLT